MYKLIIFFNIDRTLGMFKSIQKYGLVTKSPWFINPYVGAVVGAYTAFELYRYKTVTEFVIEHSTRRCPIHKLHAEDIIVPAVIVGNAIILGSFVPLTILVVGHKAYTYVVTKTKD